MIKIRKKKSRGPCGQQARPIELPKPSPVSSELPEKAGSRPVRVTGSVRRTASGSCDPTVHVPSEPHDKGRGRLRGAGVGDLRWPWERV